jgi:predicted MFS family arabinose efflux permease
MADNVTAASGGHSEASPAMWRSILCAFCASLIGIGLARFAYTPLLPAVIGAHWFDPSTAAYLGAANLAGYLAGALLGRAIASRLSLHVTLRLMMLIATAAFFACAWPLDFVWFFVWRFAAGVAGGTLMVLAAPAVLAHVPPSRRGLAGGIIFMGIGVGVVASGTLVPTLLREGLQQTWIGLGAASLLITAIAWTGWPPGTATTVAPSDSHLLKQGRLRALYAEYALNAVGWVPHMIFLVDFVARDLHRGIAVGSHYWVVFGLGATLGPILTGYFADRAGFGAALRLAFLIEAIAVAIPAMVPDPAWLLASSIGVGAFLTGTVTLVLGRIGELLPNLPAQQKVAWTAATVFFALSQAAAAYGLSFIFAWSDENYSLLFFIGTAAILAALVIDIVADVLSERSPEAQN